MYVTEQGALIRKRGERIYVEKQGEVCCEILLIDLHVLVIMGNVQLTTQAASILMMRGIEVSFLTQSGQFKGKICGQFNRNIFLRMAQFEAYQNRRVNLAAAFVEGKVNNQLTVVARSDWGNGEEKKALLQKKKEILSNIKNAEIIDELYGLEGMFAREYFKIFGLGIRQFEFSARSKRPAYDPVNAMLNFGYSLLINDVICALDMVGFETALGFLHGLRYGRASLACDLMEEFRAPIVDRLVMRLINQKMVKENDFLITSRGCYFNDEKVSWFIKEYHHQYEIYKDTVIRQVHVLRKAILNGEEYVSWSLNDSI